MALHTLQGEARAVGGPWTGQLSTSALSTATAISALHQVQQNSTLESSLQRAVQGAIDGGCRWLADHQNPDGGFGDTDRSHSNIATTLLVIAAWKMTGFLPASDAALTRAWKYVDSRGGWDGLRARYGTDKTFVVPILANCALAGLVAWEQVPALPFEAAWLPQSWYRLARMPVVSYAIPALVAIGQARHHFAPARNPLIRAVRRRAVRPTLRVLQRMQPTSGGYLEAVPLTSFVLMTLAAMGRSGIPVARNALRFILDSRLSDGSWPIDTNLATWVTSLSMAAVARRHNRLQLISSPVPNTSSSEASRREGDSRPPLGTDDWAAQGLVGETAVRWLLSCQHRQRHPFTGADPGGWGWTDLSGAVPDADDTPAALLALSYLDLTDPRWEQLSGEIASGVARGLHWLLRLQNRDGGWPTFCRGWGKLPFDRSGTDLTAHAIRALWAWRSRLDWLTAEVERAGDRPERQSAVRLPEARQIEAAIQRGFRYLARTQQPDGSWLPLWFGNQDRPDESNPVYGTGRVLLAYAAAGRTGDAPARRGWEYLRRAQNGDGGWGGGPSVPYAIRSAPLVVAPEHHHGAVSQPEGGQEGSIIHHSTVEETAVALEALLTTAGSPPTDPTIIRGLAWLTDAVQQGFLEVPWPIGFYFAKLWYYEKLYPTIFSVAALGAACRRWSETGEDPAG
ncbi:MAG: squalene--hopene cyclase [Planctomycetota bacterium]|nr:MAG: squalene--hopene cyclase [Planctomycetota bacterium]